MSHTNAIPINISSLEKGQTITKEQAEQFYIARIMGRDAYEQKLAEYERGERIYHPLGKAHAEVASHVMKERKAMGSPVVCRVKQLAIEVLTDAQAIEYRANRANSALGLHRRQADSLYADIDERNLDAVQKRQLQDNREYHTMIELSIASGKRTLKELRKNRAEGG